MNNCIPSQWGVIVKPGDKIKFIMPPFCTGDYTFDVIEKNGIPVLDDSAPSRIFDGCHSYQIITAATGGDR